MRQGNEFLVRVVLLVFIWIVWWWAINVRLSNIVNLSIIVGGVVLVFPLAWLSRKILDRHPTTSRADWMTTFVHFALGFLFGVPIIRATTTYQDWVGWRLPVPTEIGLVLVIVTGAASLLVVANLALKGLGAPFFIALRPTWNTNPGRRCCFQENPKGKRCTIHPTTQLPRHLMMQSAPRLVQL